MAYILVTATYSPRHVCNGDSLLLTQTKHAFFIGVGDCLTNNSWQDLGVANDIESLKNALLIKDFTKKNAYSKRPKSYESIYISTS